MDISGVPEPLPEETRSPNQKPPIKEIQNTYIKTDRQTEIDM